MYETEFREPLSSAAAALATETQEAGAGDVFRVYVPATSPKYMSSRKPFQHTQTRANLYSNKVTSKVTFSP
jgi:hypothetical protein